jgi:thioredoxin-like negative regulator of GroEL
MDVPWEIERAEELEREGRLTEAEEHLARAREEAPQEAGLAVALAWILDLQGRKEESAELLRTYAEEDRADAHVIAAYIGYAIDRLPVEELAWHAFRALDADPNDPFVLEKAAEVELKRGETSRSRIFVERLKELHPNRRQAARAEFRLIQAEDDDRAIEAFFNRHWEQARSDVEWGAQVAWWLTEMGRLSEALEVLNHHEPELSRPEHDLRLYLLFELEQYERLVASAERLHAGAPLTPYQIQTWAHAMFRMKRYDDAVQLLKREIGFANLDSYGLWLAWSAAARGSETPFEEMDSIATLMAEKGASSPGARLFRRLVRFFERLERKFGGRGES